jgi:outer membrane biosynthesis protein TonB
VSYILDALKKAAEQRDAHGPAMRRLFSPVPEFTESPRWRLAVVGGAAAVAGAVIAVWVLWPTPPVMTERALTTARVQPAPPAAAPVLPAAPASAPAPPPSPIVRTAPTPPAVAKAVPDKRATPMPAVQTRQAPVESVVAPAPAVATRQSPVESVAARSQPASPPPPVIATVRPAPIPTPAAPPAATPRAELGGQMRLEVIVYSDERARRLAFINGRKYVEGDLLLDGSRIQEIQPNAVVIIDDGRRVVLKP